MKEIRTIYSPEERQEVERLLLANGIEYSIIEGGKAYENAYTANPTSKHYIIMVEEAIAPQALEVLNAYFDADDDSNSILHQFDDVDLIEIQANYKNYSATKVAKAKAILLERGFSEDEIERRVRRIISEENQPQRASNWAIIGGYAFAICGWILGFAIGWFLYFSKTRHTVTGEVYYAHDEYSRKQGRNMLVFGVLFWLVVLAWIFGN
jgi:hypothetical protein